MPKELWLMEDHVNIVAALYIGFGALGILAAAIIFLAVVGGGFLSGDMDAIAITTSVGSAIALVISLFSIPGIFGGVGLIKRRSWARILVIVLGVLNLPLIPIGTILGAYTIWVLMKEDTARLFGSRTVPR